MIRRLRRGEKIWTAHRSHLYQRLLPLGHSHQFLSILYALLALVCVGLASMWLLDTPGVAACIGIGVPLVAVGLWAFVIRQERKHGRADGPRLTKFVDAVY